MAATATTNVGEIGRAWLRGLVACAPIIRNVVAMIGDSVMRSFLPCSALLIPILCVGGAQAQPYLDAVRTTNPLAAMIDGNQGCTLVRPLAAVVDAQGKPGEGHVGNLTVPLRLRNANMIDVGGLQNGGGLCKVPRAVPLPENTRLETEFGIAFRDDKVVDLKATIGNWLKLLDFNYSDLSSVQVGFRGTAITYDDGDMGAAAKAIAKDIRDNNRFCRVWSNPQAQIVKRNCVGHVYVALDAKKSLTLRAFDTKFAQITAGLKADWVKEIKGTLQNCTEGATAEPKKADPKKAEPADPKKAEPKNPAKKETDTTAQAKDGTEITIPVRGGTVTIGPAKAQITLPGNITISAGPSTVSVTKAEPKKATQAAATKDEAKKDASKKDEPKKDEAKKEEPKKADANPQTGCVTGVVYQTKFPVIYGLNVVPAKDFIDFAKQR